MFAWLFRRPDPTRTAEEVYFTALEASRRARKARDTRRIHETQQALERAQAARLQRAIGWRGLSRG